MICNIRTEHITLGITGCTVRFRRGPLTAQRIKDEVCKFFDLHPTAMTCDRRDRSVARPRQIAMYLTKELTPKSLPNIGRLFGNRDHTTVISAIKRVELLCATDGDVAADVERLRERLAG